VRMLSSSYSLCCSFPGYQNATGIIAVAVRTKEISTATTATTATAVAAARELKFVSAPEIHNKSPWTHSTLFLEDSTYTID
jgi:hypothetical protein